MMGPHKHIEPKLFYTNPASLESRIPEDHILRRIDRMLDVSFVRPAVQRFYGVKGHPSLDPIVLMKMMFLLFFENVKSERRLVSQMAYRIDWMWFCRFDLDDTIPNHSVLSKARRLWGPQVFAELFERILGQCIDAGLVEGSTVHVDASCIAGNVDTDRLQPVLRRVGLDLYEQLDQQDTDVQEDQAPQPPSGEKTAQSDQDAGVTRSYGQTVCGYKDHRVVDDAHGIITATITTDAARNEGTVLAEVLDEHERNVGHVPDTVVADRGYGIAENYKHLHEASLTPCIPLSQRKEQNGMFGHDQFAYDPDNDCFICPNHQKLVPFHHDNVRRRVRYMAAKGVCAACPLKSKCTPSKHGRRVERHMDQEHIDWADGCLSVHRRRHLMKRRKACVEGSFGDAACNHGFKRARWRGRWRMRIQNLLIAACQNLRTLLNVMAHRPGPGVYSAILRHYWAFVGLLYVLLRPYRRRQPAVIPNGSALAAGIAPSGIWLPPQ